MIIFRYLRYWYWERLLGGLYNAVSPLFGEAIEYEWLEPGFKGVVTLVGLFVLRECYVRARYGYTRYRLWKSMAGHEVREPHTAKDTSFIEEIDTAQYPVHTLEQLKKEKRYGRIGEVLSKLNQPEEAAHWFMKDKQYNNAAAEYARAGKTLKAARLLARIGDYETAVRFFIAAGRHKQAAAVARKGGDLPGAATAYIEGGYYRQGAACFLDYFKFSSDELKKKEAVADRCYLLLQRHDVVNGMANDQHNALLNVLAQQFREAGRIALAARVFQQSGDTRQASEMFKIDTPGIIPMKDASLPDTRK